MQKKTRVLGFMMILCVASLFATSMEVSGTISSNTTWTGVDTVKVIGHIVVDNGKTLTIDPGIYVEFQGYYYLKVNGTLLAVGNASERITFTAADHETGWARMIFDTTSSANDSTKIVYCNIEYGRASEGGALWIKNFHKILVSNCIFSNNYAEVDGGAIHIFNCNAYFINNAFINNETESKGGAIMIQYDAHPEFINNTICNNIANNGGGIFCYYNSDPIFKNTIIYGNSAFLGDQVALMYNSCDPDFYYCDIEGSVDDFYLYEGSYTGDYENCIDLNPLFVGSGEFPYDLTDTSPCINLGDPATTENVGEYDQSGEIRIQQGRIEIGAYEEWKFPDGIPGNALEFDGIDDYVVMKDSIDFSGDYTIEFWFNTSLTDENQDILAGTVNDDHGILLEITTSNLVRFLHRNPPGTTGGVNVYSTDSYNDGEWHHLAAVKEGTSIKLYLDGSLSGATTGATDFVEPLDFNLGSLRLVDPIRFYEGKLDEVCFWNYACAVEQIRENMHLTPDGTEPGLTNYWQFNEGFDIYCNELISGNYGTLFNMDEDDWIDSTIPIGIGASQTMLIDNTYAFYYEDVEVQLFAHTNSNPDTVVVSRLETNPNIDPADVYETLDSQYYIIDLFGDGINGQTDILIMDLLDNITPEDQENPQQIQLYRRESNSDGDWSFCQYADFVGQAPDNVAKFNDIGGFSQFIICRNAVPNIEVIPSSFSVELQRGGNSTQQLTIENTGTGDLEFEISLNQSRDSGGPDVFGYEWIDSDEPGGPTYEWFDISTIGTEIISNGDWTYSECGNANDAYKEISLPFVFFFYGEAKNSVKISSNGYLTFGNDGTDVSVDPIPDSNEPNDLIAPFWTNLDPSIGGYIYYYSDTLNNKFVIQYQDVPHFSEPANTNTFQVILSENGEIIFQYEDITNPYYTSAGIENNVGSDGLEISYNDYYIHNELAVKFTTLYWLSLETYSSSVPSGSPLDIDVYFKTRNLPVGVYTDSLHITSNDPDEPEVIIPVTLTILDSLDIPQNVYISINGSNVEISWDEVTGANSYKIFASDDPNAADWGDAVASVSGTSWSYTITEDRKFYYVTASSESVTRDSVLERKTSEVSRDIHLKTVNALQRKSLSEVSP